MKEQPPCQNSACARGAAAGPSPAQVQRGARADGVAPAPGAGGLPSWSSAAHGLAAGGGGAKKGKAFTLYELPAATGFAWQSKAGALKYNQLCRAAGLLPVGCGTSGSDCDASRYFGSAECVPMPAAWGCVMDGPLATATGWRSVVTFQADAAIVAKYGEYLDGTDAAGSYHRPSAGDALRPVCAKMAPP